MQFHDVQTTPRANKRKGKKANGISSWLEKASRKIDGWLWPEPDYENPQQPEQVLTLRLIYKDRLLDTIRQGTDFTRKWFIGKGTRIFWQILGADPDFPDKHKIIYLDDDSYHMQLPPGATPINLVRNGEAVDVPYLIRNKLLVDGSNLLLSPDMAGTVEINDKYKIHYGYFKPVSTPLTQDQIKVIKDARIRARDAQEGKNRRIIMWCLIIGLASILIFDNFFKPETLSGRTLQEELAEWEKARRIEFEPTDRPTSSSDIGSGAEASQPPRDANPREGTSTGTPTARRSGIPGGPATNIPYRGTGPAGYDTDYWGEFVRPGGSGPNTGAVNPTPRGTSDPNYTGSVSFIGNFNPWDVGNGSSRQIEEQAFSGVSAGVTGAVAAKPAERFTGDTSRSEELVESNKPLPQSESQRQIIVRFNSPEITRISEASVYGSTAGRASDVDNVVDQLFPKKNQIYQAYRRNVAIRAQSGSINVLLAIGGNGNVLSAQITPNGQFTNSFMDEVEQIIRTWRFSVTKECSLQFSLRLSQGG